MPSFFPLAREATRPDRMRVGKTHSMVFDNEDPSRQVAGERLDAPMDRLAAGFSV